MNRGDLYMFELIATIKTSLSIFGGIKSFFELVEKRSNKKPFLITKLIDISLVDEVYNLQIEVYNKGKSDAFQIYFYEWNCGNEEHFFNLPRNLLAGEMLIINHKMPIYKCFGESKAIDFRYQDSNLNVYEQRFRIEGDNSMKWNNITNIDFVSMPEFKYKLKK